MKVLGTILLLCVFGIPRIATTADRSPYKSPHSSSTPAPSTWREVSASQITFVSRNFRVLAPAERLAREVAEAAEVYRNTLALSWFGSPLRDWDAPYLIRASVGHKLRANVTTNSDGREITLEGTRALLLNSMLPRGILHSLFATRFEQPVPVWAIEGASITVESLEEQAVYGEMLVKFLTSGRGIAFKRLFAMEEYPSDVLAMFAQSHSVVRFLINQHGRRGFVDFLENGLESGDWEAALHRHYEFADLSELQLAWTEHVRARHFD